MKIKPFLFLILLITILINCGRKAPPLPPIIKIPKSVINLKANQTGYKIFLSWKNPESYTDGSPLLEINQIYIYIYEKKKNKYFRINKKEFLDKAELIQINESQFYFYSLNKEKLHNIELIFGIKVKDSKNKLSELSQLVSIKPGIPPSPPQNVNFSVYEDKILLKWDPPEKNDNSIIDGYRVYRWNEEKKIPMLLNSLPIKETSFEDRNFIYDKKYFYVIRSITYPPVFYIPLPYPFLFFNTYFHKKEELFNSIIESENSNIIEIIPKDTFPPKAPQGLVAIPGKKVITLMWDPNIERDLEGYRVWRKTEFEKEFSLLTLKPILNNSYRDEMLEENLTYYYYVTAIDKKKNESEKSQIIKIKFQKVEEGNENLSLSLSGKKILWYIEGGKSLSYRRFHIQKF